jgi:ABC-type lipoprotein release transport system permease subunit
VDPEEEVERWVEEHPEAIHSYVLSSSMLAEKHEPGTPLGFMAIEIAFIVIMIGVGINLVMISNLQQRQGELANIRSRGANRRQVFQLLAGEGASVALIGALLGTMIGILVIAFYLWGINIRAGFQLISYDLAISAKVVGIFVLTVAIVTFSILITSWYASRLDVGKLTRMKGGR